MYNLKKKYNNYMLTCFFVCRSVHQKWLYTFCGLVCSQVRVFLTMLIFILLTILNLLN